MPIVALKQLVPSPLLPLLRWLYHYARDISLPFQCPLCSHCSDGFLPYGSPARTQARCRCCGALERHRLAWTFMQRKTNLFDSKPKRLLHIAPEPGLRTLFQRIPGIQYQCGDKNASLPAERMDITAISLPDNRFDVIYCSHVLEHIEEDRRAMAELYRVLKPGGWAILQVPILRDETYEDPSVESPQERERVFGQWDHVRIYGKDFKERLEQAGFTVTVTAPAHLLGSRKRRYYGLYEDEDIHFCQRLVA